MHRRLKSRRSSWTSCTHVRCRRVLQRHREVRGVSEENFHLAAVPFQALLWLPVLWLICKVGLPRASKQLWKMNWQNQSWRLRERRESVFSVGLLSFWLITWCGRVRFCCMVEHVSNSKGCPQSWEKSWVPQTASLAPQGTFTDLWWGLKSPTGSMDSRSLISRAKVPSTLQSYRH